MIMVCRCRRRDCLEDGRRALMAAIAFTQRVGLHEQGEAEDWSTKAAWSIVMAYRDQSRPIPFNKPWPHGMARWTLQ